MVDPALRVLLRDCERYLRRQHALLDHAAGLDTATVSAMTAALDQLNHAVEQAWDETVAAIIVEVFGDVERGDLALENPSHPDIQRPPLHPEPGE
jgi:hypothetical protein